MATETDSTAAADTVEDGAAKIAAAGFGRETIHITPDVSLIKKSGEVNYSIPQAIGELIDNSIDARIPGQPLMIEVRLGQKDGEPIIVVTDNAAGMSRTGLAEAMIMALSRKYGDAIGEFGLGLKNAASFLGAEFEIVTCTADSDVAYRVVYDEDEFIRKGRWELDVDEVEKPFEHGTRIRITRLKVNLYAGVKNVVLDSASKTWRHFIANENVTIAINRTEAEPYTYDTLNEYDTEIDFELNGRRVRGWASLMPSGSGRGQYGFDLVRHNRVMAEYQKVGFSPNSSLTRLVGELHLDDFPVVNNKTAFRADTKEWDDLQKAVRERINDLLRESRRLANPGRDLSPKDKSEVEEHIEKLKESLKDQSLLTDLDRRALDSAMADEGLDGPVPFDIPDDASDEDGTPDTPRSGGPSGVDSDKDDREPSHVTAHRLTKVKTTLRNIRIEHQVANIGKDSRYQIWEVEGVGSNKRLVVTTNASHPFIEAFGESLMTLIKHNIVEAVAEYITEETGTAEAMLLVKSDILKHIGRMQLAVMDEVPWDAETGEPLEEIA